MPSSRIRKRVAKTKNRENKGARWVAVHEFKDPGSGERTSESKTFDTRAEAKTWLDARRAEESPGRFFVKASSELVGDFLDRWLRDGLGGKGEASRAGAREIVRLYLRPNLGGLKLSEVDRLQVDRLVTKLFERGLSSSTIRLALSTLRAALSAAVAWNLLPDNPAAEVKLPKKKRPGEEIRSMNQRQAAAFVEALEGERLRPLFLVLLFAGLRPSEAFALRWSDVTLDDDDPSLRVTRSVRLVDGVEGPVFGDTKTSSGRRTVSLPDLVVDALREERLRAVAAAQRAGRSWDDRFLVFPARGSAAFPDDPEVAVLDRHNVTRVFHRVLRRAGLGQEIVEEGRNPKRTRTRFVPAFRLYDLRHSAATLLLRSGTDIRTVSSVLGHSDPGFTLRTYAHALPDAKRESADRLAAFVVGDPRTASAPADLDEPVTESKEVN